jgi:putative transposase
MGAAVRLEVLVVWALVYLALRRVLGLIVLCWQSADAKEVEILVLRHQLAILRRQHPRPRLQTCAACGPQPPAAQAPMVDLHGHTPRCGLNRTAMAGRRWTYPTPARSQPSVPQQVQTLIVRLATENPRWGDQRIRGELLGVGCQVCASSIARVLRANGLPQGATLASLAPADPAVPHLHWSRRGQGVECTTRVPLDYDRPDPA